MRKNLTWVALVAFTLILTMTTYGDQPVNERCDASAQGRVSVSVISGDLRFLATDGNEVLVTGTVGDDVKEFQVKCGRGSVRIELELPKRSGKNLKLDANLQIQVPRSSQVSASTVSANVAVMSVEGSLSIESVSGELTFEGDLGIVSGESVSGDVLVRGAVTEGELESVSGNVIVERAQGRLEASSVSGTVKVLAGEVASGQAQSVSGNIVWHAGVEAGGKLELESHSGTVNLELPQGSGAQIEASSFSGSITNQLNEDRPEEEALGLGRSLSTNLGNGAARIEVETFSGEITLSSS